MFLDNVFLPQVFSAIFIPLNVVAGYKVSNRLSEDHGSNQDRFWFYKSPLCEKGNPYFASVLSIMEIIVFILLVSVYGYLRYQCDAKKVDMKYTTYLTELLPLLVILVALGNGFIALHPLLASNSEIPRSLLQLFAIVCISIADYRTYREAIVAVRNKQLAVSRFARGSNVELIAPVPDRLRSGKGGPVLNGWRRLRTRGAMVSATSRRLLAANEMMEEFEEKILANYKEVSERRVRLILHNLISSFQLPYSMLTTYFCYFHPVTAPNNDSPWCSQEEIQDGDHPGNCSHAEGSDSFCED